MDKQIDIKKFTENFTGFLVYRFSDFADFEAKKMGDYETAWDEWLTYLSSENIVLRGIYDLEAFRFDADLMIWLHTDEAEKIQNASRKLNSFMKAANLLKRWSAIGVHREAEFNPNHVPGFVKGTAPCKWLTVYPFVRALDWYVLEGDQRKQMLKEHGMKGAQFRDVVANTVSTFALSDYEWLLPMESDKLLSLVDMMRALRATEARKYVREETPFFTGKRINKTKLYSIIQENNND